MSMPQDLIFVRHGQSEANIVQKSDDHGLSPEVAAEIRNRPDWRNRLTAAGVEQAKQAGLWIEQNIGPVASFDALYVSPFLRTRETAAHLGGISLNGWTVDDRLVERSWGVYGSVSRAEQRVQFPRTAKAKDDNPWYIRLDGGESMPDVYARFRDFQSTLHREQEGKRVLVVSHGDFINVARYGVERMLPEQWEEIDADKAFVIRNCMVLHYSRVNPNDPSDVRPKLTWRRYANPSEPGSAPNGGEWTKLPERQRFSGADLLEQLEFSPHLIERNKQDV